MSLQIRHAQIGDLAEINALYSVNARYLRDDAYWIWINRVWHRQSVSAVAVLDGKIVGTYSAGIKEICFNDRRVRAAIGYHALMTEEARQRVGIYEVTSFVYERLKALGIPVIFGFPNSAFRDVQVRLEKWKQISKFHCLVGSRFETGIGRLNVEELEYLAAASLYEELFESSRSENRIEFMRTAGDFIGRFHSHPQNKYRFLRIGSESHPSAIAVLKEFEEDQQVFGHVIDLQTRPGHHVETWQAIICDFNRRGVQNFRFWPIHETHAQVLANLGFEKNGFETFFGCKVLDKRAFTDEEIKQLIVTANWNLQMSDSDVF